jgi:hypothetical protein
LLPDLRITSTYGLNGLGTRLDGPGTDNAFRSLASDKFTDWNIGLRFSYLIGYRDAHAQTRVARLNLARSYLTLQDQERKALRFLELKYRQIFSFHAQIEINKSQREAAAEQLQARFKEYQAGRGTLDILLESQRVWAQALQDEYNAIVQYNNSLAGFEFAKGTILHRDNVVIADGPLPHCAQVRAVEHERERAKAFVLLERADPVVSSPCNLEKGCLGLPQLPSEGAPPIPSLLEGNPALLEGKEPLPSITDALRQPASLTETKMSGPTPLSQPAGRTSLPDSTSSLKLPAGIQPAGPISATAAPSTAPAILPTPRPASENALPTLPAVPMPGDSSSPKLP